MSKKGFTLIELLVVIAIIGLLSSIALASLEGARLKARDSKRMSDILQIHQALALYFDDFGNYTHPENMCSDTSYGGFGGCGSAGGTGDWDANSDLRDLITHGYMQTLPVDPINNTTYRYMYEPSNSSGTAGSCASGRPACAYRLCAVLEGGGSFCKNDIELHL